MGTAYRNLLTGKVISYILPFMKCGNNFACLKMPLCNKTGHDAHRGLPSSSQYDLLFTSFARELVCYSYEDIIVQNILHWHHRFYKCCEFATFFSRFICKPNFAIQKFWFNDFQCVLCFNLQVAWLRTFEFSRRSSMEGTQGLVGLTFQCQVLQLDAIVCGSKYSCKCNLSMNISTVLESFPETLDRGKLYWLHHKKLLARLISCWRKCMDNLQVSFATFSSLPVATQMLTLHL